MKPEKISIEPTSDGKGIIITTFRDYIKKVEKCTANTVRIDFED